MTSLPIRSAVMLFTDRHTQTNYNENINPPQFPGVVNEKEKKEKKIQDHIFVFIWDLYQVKGICNPSLNTIYLYVFVYKASPSYKLYLFWSILLVGWWIVVT